MIVLFLETLIFLLFPRLFPRLLEASRLAHLRHRCRKLEFTHFLLDLALADGDLLDFVVHPLEQGEQDLSERIDKLLLHLASQHQTAVVTEIGELLGDPLVI
jgi:hypothetical protein